MSVLSKKNERRRGALKVHLVGVSEGQRIEIRTALAAVGEPPLDIVEMEPSVTEASDAPCDVSMVIFDGGEDESLTYLQHQATLVPRPVLFALLHERSPDLMKRVLRAGADELLFLPLDIGDSTRALLKISEARRRESDTQGGGKICSFVSLVGGTGVTSLCANLALALRYALDKKVGIFDLDLQTGAASVFLNLEPDRTVMGLIEGERKLDSIQLESALSKHSSGVYLLAAPKRIEDSELVTDAKIGAILDLMRQLFDYVIVDCGTHIDANAVAAWERSQSLFYVLDQSIGAARCAWRFVDLVSRLGLNNAEPQFILSRFLPSHPISEDQLTHTLGQPLYAKVPRDEKVLERVQLSAQDLWQVAPNCPLAKSVEELARRIDTRGETVSAAEQEGSIMSRLLLAIGARA